MFNMQHLLSKPSGVLEAFPIKRKRTLKQEESTLLFLLNFSPFLFVNISYKHTWVFQHFPAMQSKKNAPNFPVSSFAYVLKFLPLQNLS